jgi:hypothetical protein
VSIEQWWNWMDLLGENRRNQERSDQRLIVHKRNLDELNWTGVKLAVV